MLVRFITEMPSLKKRRPQDVDPEPTIRSE
jgi:hypothetical protein